MQFTVQGKYYYAIPFETITTDNGKEFCKHQEIAKNIGCSFYFARPYKSCDRDLNEHTNGLIRRVFPKKTDFSTISDEEVIRVQNLLNNKPRKILGYLTPMEVITKHLNRIYKPKKAPPAV
jgi:IS30 family transposase